MDSGVSLSDDYVAELLKKDAKSTNIRFSALGLHSVLPTRWVDEICDDDAALWLTHADLQQQLQSLTHVS